MDHRNEGFRLTDLSLMCVAYPLFRSKCAGIEDTEHFRATDRERLGKELAELEEENLNFMKSSTSEENNIKEELRLLDILLGRFRSTKSDDQERLIIAAMRKQIAKKNSLTELYNAKLEKTQTTHKARIDRQTEQTAIQRERALALADNLRDLLNWEHVHFFMSPASISAMEKKMNAVTNLANRYAKMDLPDS